MGLIYAVLSAVFKGYLAPLFKTRCMREISLLLMIFQLYVAIGVFPSSVLISGLLLPVDSFCDDYDDTFIEGLSGRRLVGIKLGMLWEGSWNIMGMIAGCLFVHAIAFSFPSIELIGVATAQGTWGGVTMVVAYFWGVVIFREIPKFFKWSLLALVILILGVMLIASCTVLGDKVGQKSINNRGRLCDWWGSIKTREGKEYDENDRLLKNVELGTTTGVGGGDSGGDLSSDIDSSSQYLLGVGLACCVGLFGGSILAPMRYVPDEYQGLAFLPSFGMGTLLTSPVLLYLYHITLNTSPFPQFHIRAALPTGIISGLIYNISNMLSILAIPLVGYSVAKPILQCSLFFSGLWGIYYFNEMKNPNAVMMFWIGGILLVTGSTVITFSE